MIEKIFKEPETFAVNVKDELVKKGLPAKLYVSGDVYICISTLKIPMYNISEYYKRDISWRPDERYNFLDVGQIANEIFERYKAHEWDDTLWDFNFRSCSVETDKKTNAQYWDDIDNYTVQFIKNIAGMSIKPIDMDSLEDKIYASGVHAEVRETVVGLLESLGANFPFVDENM